MCDLVGALLKVLTFHRTQVQMQAEHLVLVCRVFPYFTVFLCVFARFRVFSLLSEVELFLPGGMILSQL